MLTVLKQISDSSTKDFNRIYIGNDPVVVACNRYYNELFGMNCTEVRQEGKQFIPVLSKTIKAEANIKMVSGEFVIDKPEFEQLEFNF